MPTNNIVLEGVSLKEPTKSQKTVRQHFVPNSFQKNFALHAKNCMILEFEADNNSFEYRTYLKKTSKNFFIENFYETNFTDMDGLEDELTLAYQNMTEVMLSKFESDWAVIVRRLLKNVDYDAKRKTKKTSHEISQYDMESLIALITNIYFRNPHRFHNLKSDSERVKAYFNILGMQSLFSIGTKCTRDLENMKSNQIIDVWNSKMDYVINMASKNLTTFNINIAHKDSIGFVLPEDPAMFHETNKYILGSLPISPKVQIQFYIDKTRKPNPSGIIAKQHYLTKGTTKIQLKNHSLFGGDRVIVQNDNHAKQIVNIMHKFV